MRPPFAKGGRGDFRLSSHFGADIKSLSISLLQSEKYSEVTMIKMQRLAFKITVG